MEGKSDHLFAQDRISKLGNSILGNLTVFRCLPIRTRFVRVYRVMAVACFRVSKFGYRRARLSVLVGLLRLSRFKDRSSIQYDRAITARIGINQSITRITSVMVIVIKFTCLVRSLICPIPRTDAGRSLKFVFSVIPVLNGVTQDVSREIYVLARRVKLVKLLLIRAARVHGTQVRIQIGVNDDVLSLMICQAYEFRFLNCFVRDRGVLSNSALIAR